MRPSLIDNLNGNTGRGSSNVSNLLPSNSHLHLKGYRNHLHNEAESLDSATTSTTVASTTNNTALHQSNPVSSPTSSFFLMITGHIESAQTTSSTSLNDHLYCRYSFSYGPDWEVVHGVSMGLSQIGRQGVFVENNGQGGNEAIVWNFPIEISFQSTNPHGWPRLAISIYGFDFMGRDVVRGYASLLLPLTPGRHVRYVKTYRPVSGSRCQQFVNWLMGTNPEYYDSKMVTRGDGRSVTRVVSDDGMIVKVALVATRKDFSTFGYTTSSSQL